MDATPPRDEFAIVLQDAAVGVITTTVGGMLGPPGAIVAGLIGTFGTFGIRRLLEVSERILRETGLDQETIVARLDEDARLAHLVADAFRGAVESDLAAKRVLLAKAVVRALEDDAMVDIEGKFVRAAAAIDTVDVRLLAIIGRSGRQTLDQVADSWPGAANVLEASAA